MIRRPAPAASRPPIIRVTVLVTLSLLIGMVVATWEMFRVERDTVIYVDQTYFSYGADYAQHMAAWTASAVILVIMPIEWLVGVAILFFTDRKVRIPYGLLLAAGVVTIVGQPIFFLSVGFIPILGVLALLFLVLSPAIFGIRCLRRAWKNGDMDDAQRLMGHVIGVTAVYAGVLNVLGFGPGAALHPVLFGLDGAASLYCVILLLHALRRGHRTA